MPRLVNPPWDKNFFITFPLSLRTKAEYLSKNETFSANYAIEAPYLYGNSKINKKTFSQQNDDMFSHHP
jgi:hypothetical protein